MGSLLRLFFQPPAAVRDPDFRMNFGWEYRFLGGSIFASTVPPNCREAKGDDLEESAILALCPHTIWRCHFRAHSSCNEGIVPNARAKEPKMVRRRVRRSRRRYGRSRVSMG